jgi:hypothetical protein
MYLINTVTNSNLAIAMFNIGLFTYVKNVKILTFFFFKFLVPTHHLFILIFRSIGIIWETICLSLSEMMLKAGVFFFFFYFVVIKKKKYNVSVFFFNVVCMIIRLCYYFGSFRN